MIDPDVLKKVGNDPRLAVIESYLSKNSHKDKNVNENAYLKQKGLNHFASEFQTDLNKGLTTSGVSKNAQKYGKNEFKKKKTKGFFQILLGVLSDEMLIVLMVAAVISIVVEYFFSDQHAYFWLEGVSILCAVAVVSLVASFNDYEKQQQFEQLNKIQQNTNIFKVLRNSNVQQIHLKQIVVGDIIMIEGGNQLPCDGLIIKAQQVVVDESSITGQAHEKFKNTIQVCPTLISQDSPSSILISGTSVKSGSLKMLALVVGKQSTSGKLSQQIFDDQNDQKTPLQIKLDILVQQIGRLGVYSAIIVIVALTMRLLISDIIPHGWKNQFIGQILQYVIIGVSIVVVAIPEGLPLAVTLSLAYSVKQMLTEKNLVRKLASCETMGGAHVICTDKTGTLTQNQMSVVQLWSGKLFNSQSFKQQFAAAPRDLVLKSLLYNTKAELQPKPQGSSTQIALLKYCKWLSPQFFSRNSKTFQKDILHRIPFNSDRKRMSTLIGQGNTKILLQKGGVEIILQACNKMDINGYVQPINRSQVDRNVQAMAKKGYRVIAIAYKIISQAEDRQFFNINTSNSNKDQNGVMIIQKNDFTLQMLVGIQDLPRPQTKGAIQDCHRGKVVVVMVTGDNKLTARAIADQVGITKPGDNTPGLVRDGKQIDQIYHQKDPYVIERFLKNLKVMARSRPQHKYKLVDCIKRLNNVVAVTGDGTNDAPALMKADVGFAMGVKGTQIAKSASDIIIMDDKFDSIVRALIWGRNIYESIRKFLQFQLTANAVACLLSMLSSIIMRQSVLTALQMLWINMIMDSLASLALATQPPNGDQLLDRKPFEKREKLITKTMIKHVVGQSIFQMIVLLLLIFVGPYIIPEYADQYDSVIGTDLNAKYFNGQLEGTITNGMSYTLSGQKNYVTYFQKYHVYSRHLTFIFTTFVMMQFFNFFNCRRIRDQHNIFDNPCSNYLYWAIVALIFILQWLIVTYLNTFFKLYNFHGLTIQQWLLAILIGSTVLLVSQILRSLPYARPDEDQNDQLIETSNDLVIKYKENDTDGQQGESNDESNQKDDIRT